MYKTSRYFYLVLFHVHFSHNTVLQSTSWSYISLSPGLEFFLYMTVLLPTNQLIALEIQFNDIWHPIYYQQYLYLITRHVHSDSSSSILMSNYHQINRKRKITSCKQACIGYLSFLFTLLVAYSNSISATIYCF